MIYILMPELPEVETIVQQLKKRILDRKVSKVDILDKTKIDPKIKELAPFKVTNIYRKAKSIIIELEEGNYLLIHLRMTGHFHYAKKNKENKLVPFEKYVLAKFYLDDGSVLTHNSIRRFGGIKLVNRTQLIKELAKFGMEPLSKEFSLDNFKRSLEKKKRANVKTTLMDQKIVVGIGNIYAQEILYHAQIDPNRKVGSLFSKEEEILYHKVKEILKKAVDNHGTTVENYVHIEGSGGFQKFLTVYGKKNCPKGHKLKKLNLGGRGTSYCPKCQK